jgi:hypothetical protein
LTKILKCIILCSILLIPGRIYCQQKDPSISIQLKNYIPEENSEVITTIENRGMYSRKLEDLGTNANYNVHIPPGQSLIYKFCKENKQLHQFAIPYYDSLTSLAKQAIEKAPLWLKSDLRDVFIQLDSCYQDKWSACILAAKDPYVDEVAFSISALSPQYLSSTYAFAEMFRINAELIYKYDSLFKYVMLKNYGTAKQGGNYYTTAIYRQKDTSGNIVEVEIPPEIYYWYVVHPKISDETPGFVDPLVIEDNPNINLTTPQDGKFWREYIFNHNDPDIPNKDFGIYTTYVDTSSHVTTSGVVSEAIYKQLARHMLDTLAKLDYIWDGAILSGMVSCYKNDHVMAALNRYVGSVMHFWSTPQERPHQPVRILKWGVGRCGEHEDLTAAVGRTALIPSAGVEAVSSDHVWNSFYFNAKWWPWEPVNGFVGRDFPDGNGNRWASVNHRRSDGITEIDVAKDYSNQSGLIRVKVADKNLKPIDGANVVLYAKEASGTNILYDNVRNTDHNGIAEFEVGNGRIYYAKIYALGQEKPTGNSVLGVTSNTTVDSGKVYNTTFRFSNIILTNYNLSVYDSVTSSNTQNRIKFDLKVPDEVIYGRSLPDDLGNIQIREHRKSNPTVMMFCLNEENYLAYKNNSYFKAFDANIGFTTLDTIIYTNDNNDLYFVIRNNYNQNYINLSGSVTYEVDGKTIEVLLDSKDTIYDPALIKIPETLLIYPNPASSNFNIVLKDVNKNKIEVYDMVGRPVYNYQKVINQNNIEMDFAGLNNGLYQIVVNGNGKTLTGKLLLLNRKK